MSTTMVAFAINYNALLLILGIINLCGCLISCRQELYNVNLPGHLLPQKHTESANVGDTPDGEVKQKNDVQKVGDSLM